MTFLDITSRDPEDIGPESAEELNFRQRFIDSIHEPEMGPNGRCKAEVYKFCYEHKLLDTCEPCGAQYASVIHTNEDLDFRARHDHGGGDCMCFEY